MPNPPTAAFDFLLKVHSALVSAFESATGRTVAREQVYLLSATEHALKIVSGFVTLWRGGQHHASMMLIRPLIETVFHMTAMRRPGFLLRKVFNEFQEEFKLLRIRDPKNAAAAVAQGRRKFKELKQKLLSEVPDYPIAGFCKKLTVHEVARIAGMQECYDRNYRLLCQFSHGSFYAMAGSYAKLMDGADVMLVINSMLEIIECLSVTPADLPDLDSLWAEFKRLRATQQSS